MSERPIAQRIDAMEAAAAPFLRFFEESSWSASQGKPGICDFVAGNPQEMPLPEIAETIQRWSVPRDKAWFAYTLDHPAAQEAAAAALRRRVGLAFDAPNIAMTKGAFGGLGAILQTVVDSGDEVIFLSPPWFFYELMIRAIGAMPVRVKVDMETFDLDVEAIERAITKKTRAIIINSPNNPTGKIYPAETLQRLAAVLASASEGNGRTIYLLSDEAYCRILYEGARFVSPVTFYPSSFLIYTYGKTLLTPGARLGYVALPPAMPDRERIRQAVMLAQLNGWGWPDAVMQYALPDLEKLSIDIGALQRRRDRMVSALREQGYDLHSPEGTFYLLPRSPDPDDEAFCRLLASEDVFVLPGAVVEMPGYFRISITASDDMVERALPVFGRAIEGFADRGEVTARTRGS